MWRWRVTFSLANRTARTRAAKPIFAQVPALDAASDPAPAEGEFYHYMEQPINSFKGWRIGWPPQLYPTYSNAYGLGVTHGSFTEVSCLGIPSHFSHLQPANNSYKNPFGSQFLPCVAGHFAGTFGFSSGASRPLEKALAFCFEETAHRQVNIVSLAYCGNTPQI